LAVDGYLSFSRVTCDTNENSVADDGEPVVYSVANGRFTFPNGCLHSVLVSGGSSVDTLLPLVGQLRAPAGAAVVSPLTTLLADGLTQAQLNLALGLPAATDVTRLDPAATAADGSLVNLDLYKKTLAVQQLLQKVTEMFTGLASITGSAAVLPVYDQVAKSIANALKAGTLVLITGSGAGTVLDQTVVTALIKQAAIDVGNSGAVNASVSGAVKAQNADAVAVAAAPSLTAQANAILASLTAPTLIATTIVQQSDTKLVNAIVDNKSKLTAAPSSATTALANLIKTGVMDPNTTTVQSNYLALAADSLSLVNAASTTTYSVDQFQSPAGISVSWPLQATAQLKVNLTEVGSFSLAANQKVSAAVQIEQVGGSGLLQGYIDNVAITKTGSNIAFLVGSTANSMVYGVSGDGKTKATVSFSAAVRNIHNTLIANTTNNILVGDVVTYAINQVSNDFTNINSIRGTYKVTIVVTDLPLRKLDGTQFKTYTINVPTTLSSTGSTTNSLPVTGYGLQGYITLTN
jgi:hypothetical protein